MWHTIVGRLTMHTEKHQFETQANRRYESVGRGGYAVGGIPWYNLYYGGYGYGSGYYGGSGTTKDLTEAEKSEIRMETYDGTATGSGEGTGYDSGSGAL
jgi:hypothetical protein